MKLALAVFVLLAGCAPVRDLREEVRRAAFLASATCPAVPEAESYIGEASPPREQRVLLCQRMETRYGIFKVVRLPRCADMRVYCED